MKLTTIQKAIIRKLAVGPVKKLGLVIEVDGVKKGIDEIRMTLRTLMHRGLVSSDNDVLKLTSDGVQAAKYLVMKLKLFLKGKHVGYLEFRQPGGVVEIVYTDAIGNELTESQLHFDTWCMWTGRLDDEGNEVYERSPVEIDGVFGYVNRSYVVYHPIGDGEYEESD
ncbi:MAG: hypothetical protein GTO45_22280, partial [Candidatus Aminicenantes bacterium]|nr:hypothetical protein [Candidatus Aminicenantes bacterium]NIM84083.1 hypothetical protein [Candidatus Aminicenantes bacterium]NIN20863.1 hypothetical protein [Candidatus Aminicenantes bacterium]NIN44684.1 hypothetical protein [Candidatus Aminicenantes bacterium]NIN87492.1 hypothetical protein [Candidatus Aminicenantes bacterium]